MIYQAFILTQELLQLLVKQAEWRQGSSEPFPVSSERIDELSADWNRLINEIRQFNQDFQLTPPPQPSAWTQFFSWATSSAALGTLSMMGMAVWSYLVGIQAVLLSPLLERTLTFCITMLGWLIAMLKEGLGYWQAQKQYGNQLVKKEVLKPLVKILKKHRLSEPELKMHKIVPTVEKTQVLVEQGGKEVGKKLDQMENGFNSRLGEIKSLLTANQTPQADGVGGSGASVSHEEWVAFKSKAERGFKQEVKTLRSELSTLGVQELKEQDQILAKLIIKGLQPKKLYTQAVKELVNELEFSSSSKDDIKHFLYDHGETYYEALRDLKNFSAEGDRWENLCLFAGINSEDFPAPSSTSQSEQPSPDTILKIVN